MPWRDRLIGVGLDSSEVGHPPSKFQRVFARGARSRPARRRPCRRGRAARVCLGSHRPAGHRAHRPRQPLRWRTQALVRRIAADGLPLTVCPLSNLRLCVVENLEAHPLKRMLDAGLKATVNSDDPAYFGGYLNDNMIRVAEALDLDRSEILAILRNGLDASFAAPDWKTRALAEFDVAAAA